jgi:hypothetical protein
MSRVSAAALLVLGLTAQGALADVTAEDVWQDWKGYLAGFGYEVTGTPQSGAQGLVIPDLGLSQTLPEDGGRVEMRLGRIELRERGDGTVSVIYPESLPMALALTPAEGEAVTALLRMAHSGLEITASGTPGALRYVYSADDLRFDLGEVTVDGVPVDQLEAKLRLAGIAGASVTQPEEGGRRFLQDVTSGPVQYELRFTDPEAGSALDYAGEVQSLGYNARMHLPDGLDASDMSAALAAGLKLNGQLGFGAGEGRFSVTEAGETTRGTSSSARTELDGDFSAEGLAYGLLVEGLEAEVESDGLPVPMAYGIGRLGAKLSMPVTQSEAMQDFGLVLDLGGLTLSDTIWSMIDPGARLPRDPADLTVDLSGRGRLTADIFDPAKMEALTRSGESPGEIESMVLNRLLLSLAGAKLTGAGAVELDPPQGNEMPPAEGTVDLRLEGGNGLLDRLIEMGLVPQDQATMVRMMAAMFAQADEGEDTLTSRIELQKDGSIRVNGQRLR